MQPGITETVTRKDVRTKTGPAWQRYEVCGADAVRQLCDDIALDLTAEDYPISDIRRLARTLGEMVCRAFRPAAPGGPAPPQVRLQHRVGPAEVHVVLLGTQVEVLHLVKGWQLGWTSYRRRGDALEMLTCRLVH